MADKKNTWTQQRPDGRWETKREGSQRASSVHRTQAQAWERGKELARNDGGEAFLKNSEGKIRERNTYGKDPFPPKG